MQAENQPNKKSKTWIIVLVIGLGLLLFLAVGAGGCYYFMKNTKPEKTETNINQSDLTSQGYEYLKNHQYEEARAAFSKAIAENSEDADAYLGRAKAYFYDPKNDKEYRSRASADTEQAIKINDNLADAFVMRAELEIGISEYGKAAEQIEKALERNDESADAHLVKAYILTRQGLEDEAEKELSKAQKINPDDPRLYYLLGTFAYMKEEQDLDQAEKYFQKVIELDPAYDQAYVSLGRIYNTKKEYDLAKRQYEKALEVYPDFPDAYIRFGYNYLDQDNFERAQENFKAAEKIDPNYAPLQNAWGNYYYEAATPDYPKAIDYYTKAYNIGYSYNWLFLGNRAYAYLDMFNYKTAAEDFLRAAEINPNKTNPIYLSEAAYCYLELGDYQKAHDRAKEALAIDNQEVKALAVLGIVYAEWPGNVDFDKALEYLNKSVSIEEAYYNLSSRGYVQMLRKDWTKAIPDLQKAVAWEGVRDYYKATPWNNLCVVYYNQKNYDQAIKSCDQAIAGNAEYALPYYNLGRIYKAKGDSAKARDYFALALKYDPNYEEAKEELKGL